VYYIRYTLAGARANFSLTEKFAYALVMASRKLGPYFEVHRVTILTEQPLKRPPMAGYLRTTLEVGSRVVTI